MIRANVENLLRELPDNVRLVAAAKSRPPQEILEAVEAGIEIIGENYVQEAELAYSVIGTRASWHYIGHLQNNKVKKAVKIFDTIETIDSLEIGALIDKFSSKVNKLMNVFIEINSAEEKQKYGIMPKDAEVFIRAISRLQNIQVAGIMTMGPMLEDPQKIRPYFKRTREIFENIKSLDIPNVDMKYLSMGMSSSYKIAIEEGSNMVRIGTGIFGERKDSTI